MKLSLLNHIVHLRLLTFIDISCDVNCSMAGIAFHN